MDESKSLDDRIVMIFLVRNDIKMSKGKIAAQIGDATQYIVEDCIQRKSVTYISWKKLYNSQKIVLKVHSQREFYELHLKLIELSHKLSFPVKIVKNSQVKQISENNSIVIGFGPIKRNVVDYLIGDLKLW